jgi:hypothetical protein
VKGLLRQPFFHGRGERDNGRSKARFDAMPITAQLQRFVDDELSRCAELAQETVSLTLARLKQPDSPAHAHRQPLVQALAQGSEQFVQAFCGSLRQAALTDMQEHGTTGGAPRGASDLELMDETRVEVDIEVSAAAHLIAGSAEWELRELQAFTSTLAGQTHISADTYPLGPSVHARALWDAACAVTPLAVQRSILLRAAAGVMSGQLKMRWAAACTRLESQGVEPGIYRTVVLPSGPTTARAPTFDVTRPGALEALLPRMPGGTGVPVTVDRQIAEMMSRLFDAVLSDSRLPPAFRTLLARLQASALRVALADPSLLDAHAHPLWRLMNRIGSVAETYTLTTDPRWAALLAYCETLVDDMARAPVQDALLYKRSLTRLDAFLGEQLREQQLRAQASADALIRMEQRETLERQIAQRLTEQMVPMRVSAGVRRFVTGAWAGVLAESMQRHGEKSDETLDYLKSTDDLLWSLRLPDHPQSRKRLVAMLPGLLQRLRSGMSLVGLPPAQQQAFLDELMAIHAEALRPGAKAAAPDIDLSPQQIVQRMRDESDWNPPSSPPFSDSLIDLSSMDTVPADVLPPGAVASQDDPVQRVDTMQPGARHHLFLHNRWTRLQLLWRSPRGQFFLFAGPDPARTHSITRRALERLSEEALVKPLDDVSLIQRAVDRLMHKLGRPA